MPHTLPPQMVLTDLCWIVVIAVDHYGAGVPYIVAHAHCGCSQRYFHARLPRCAGTRAATHAYHPASLTTFTSLLIPGSRCCIDTRHHGRDTLTRSMLWPTARSIRPPFTQSARPIITIMAHMLDDDSGRRQTAIMTTTVVPTHPSSSFNSTTTAAKAQPGSTAASNHPPPTPHTTPTTFHTPPSLPFPPLHTQTSYRYTALLLKVSAVLSARRSSGSYVRSRCSSTCSLSQKSSSSRTTPSQSPTSSFWSLCGLPWSLDISTASAMRCRQARRRRSSTLALHSSPLTPPYPPSPRRLIIRSSWRGFGARFVSFSSYSLDGLCLVPIPIQHSAGQAPHSHLTSLPPAAHYRYSRHI